MRQCPRTHQGLPEAAALLAATVLGCGGAANVPDVSPARPVAPAAARPGGRERLFDGRTLSGWEVTEKDHFVGHGPVRVEDGCILLGAGAPFTGVRCTREIPKDNYEITLEARRVSGYDIFCGLTVPVGEEHVTLVLGGWSNYVAGLSNIDGRNANDNETARPMSFENGKWHRVRLRVSAARIEAWAGEERVVDFERAGHAFSTYTQLEPHRPLGFFSWYTDAALRDIEVRRIGSD